MSDERPERPEALDVRPESIPEKLRGHDQWVIWRYEWREDDGKWTKPPRDVNSGRFASSTDPDTWVSFDEALEYHQRDDTDTDGIGFAVGDDDLFAGLDLDDCRDPDTGEFESWALDIISDVPTYAEVSPSDTGARLVGLGFIPDGGNRDDLDGLEGHIEMYDKGRYLTITGHHIDGSPDDVEQVNDEIAEVHTEFIVDDDAEEEGNTDPADAPDIDTSNTGSADAVSDLTDEELVARATSASNGDKFSRLWRGSTSGYDSHSEARQGLANLLAFWTGGDESRMLSMFQSSNLCRGDDDLRTFENYEIPTALEDRTEFYDPGSGGPDEPDGVTADSDSDDWEGPDIPEPSGKLTVRNGGYAEWTQLEDGDGYWTQYTNFQLELNSMLTVPSEDQPLFDLTVHPRHGDEYSVMVSPTVFNEKREFKSTVVVGPTAVFSGGEDVLNTLKQFIGTRDAPHRTGTHHMGLHDDEWVVPEGSFTGDEWSDDPEYLYVDKGIPVERKVSLDPDDEIPDTDDVADILELLPQTRTTDRMLPVLGWFYTAPLRPLVHDWTGQFNLLFVLGDTESGKTSTLSTLWQLFGMGHEPLTADDTTFTIISTLGATNSIPMWFDEFKPSDMADYEVDRFWNEVRKTTRGGMAQRGNADKSIDEYYLHAPVVVSGEERVHGAAEERRAIFTTFTDRDTQSGTETSRAFAELEGGSAKVDGENVYYDGYDFRAHAYAYYTYVLNQDGDELQESWRDSADVVLDLLDQCGVDGVDNLVEQGLQTIYFGCELYQEFADEMGAEVPIDEEDVLDAMEYVITNQVGGSNRKSHLDSFFEIASRAAFEGYLTEDEHYTFVREGEADEELRLNIGRSFDKLAKYAREHDVAEDFLNSKDDYRERIKDVVGEGYITGRGQNSPPVSRCVALNLAEASRELDDFGKGMFTTVAEEAKAQDSATPLTDATPGYHTLTVTCISSTTDTPDAIAEMGTLKDATGTVDYVVWERAGAVGLEEGEHYRIQDANCGHDPDGAPQVELDAAVATIEKVGAGVGYISPEDPEENQQIRAATDGNGVVQAQEKVLNIIRNQGPLSKSTLKGVASEQDVDPERAEDEVENLKRKGRIIDQGGNLEVP